MRIIPTTKPHIGYYDQVFSDAQVDPNEVLMVGNNVVEDGAIRALGAQVIFVTDYLINPLERRYILTPVLHA